MFGVDWARNLGDAFHRTRYTDEALLISLHNSLKLHEHSVRQSQSILGRLMALLGKPLAEPDKIEIDGMRVKQLFELADSTPPILVKINKNYFLDTAEVRSLLDAVTNSRKPA